MQLFYNSEISTEEKKFTFSKDESKHIIKVLRKKEGDTLHITNGNDYLFNVQIIVPNDKKCVVEIKDFQKTLNNRNYYLHVAIAPTKNIDRFEWFLEKATEIGIDEITPLLCKNSERKHLKIDRLNKILQSALKQSLQYKLPKLNGLTDFKNFINNKFIGEGFIAHCENDDKKYYLKNIVKLRSRYTILIGPEGDFSLDEIENSKKNGFTPINLGKTRLRTETAGITCCQNINFLHQ